MIESRTLTDYTCDRCKRVETTLGAHLRLPPGWAFLACKFNEDSAKAKDAAPELVCSAECSDALYLERRSAWMPTLDLPVLQP